MCVLSTVQAARFALKIDSFFRALTNLAGGGGGGTRIVTWARMLVVG